MNSIAETPNNINKITAGATWKFRTFSTRLIAVAIVAAFASGAVAGVMFNSAQVARQMRSVATNPESHSGEVYQQLKQQLVLTVEQESRVKEIVEKHFENSEQIRSMNLPKILEEFDRFEIELSETLTGDQQEKWQSQAQWIRMNCYGVDGDRN